MLNNYNLKKYKINNINQIKINVVSPEKIKNWTKREQLIEIITTIKNKKEKIIFRRTIFGEIRDPLLVEENTNKKRYTQKGLFSESIFGPITDFTCSCHLKQNQNIEIFKDCKVCNVTKTFSEIRNYRFGFIPLFVPIFNSLFFLSSLNLPQLFLGLSKADFINLIYFSVPKEETTSYIKTLEPLLNINEEIIKFSSNGKKDTTQLRELLSKAQAHQKELDLILKNLNSFINFYSHSFISYLTDNTFITLNEKIYNFLDSLNKNKEIKLVSAEMLKIKKFNVSYKILSKKFRLLESIIKNEVNLSWTMFKALPVTPPGFRPFDIESDENSKASKFNLLYQNIIRINERLYKLKRNKIGNQSLILSEIRLLQEAVDFLIDNNKIEKNLTINDKPMKSLTDIIKGKTGRFRKNILGKRINFSARSVIVVDPFLKIHQCAIPFEILENLFSFKITNILKVLYADNDIEKLFTNKNIKFKIIQRLIKHEAIMLNRAPTLHKLGIQSFDVVLTNDKAIHLHPLVCSAYNADFDGDQMAVYIPLTKISALELKLILKSTKELFLFGNSNLKMKPTQELILGLNYLSLKNEKLKSFCYGHYFNDYNDFLSCFLTKKLHIHTPIWVNNKFKQNNNLFDYGAVYKRITPGRLILSKIFNNNLN